MLLSGFRSYRAMQLVEIQKSEAIYQHQNELSRYAIKELKVGKVSYYLMYLYIMRPLGTGRHTFETPIWVDSRFHIVTINCVSLRESLTSQPIAKLHEVQDKLLPNSMIQASTHRQRARMLESRYACAYGCHRFLVAAVSRRLEGSRKQSLGDDSMS